MEISVTSLIPGIKIKSIQGKNESLLKEKITAPVIEKNNIDKIITGLLKGVGQSQFPVVRDSFLIITTEKNRTQIRINSFKPYWTITGFLSYDRANYRLDSDLPAIKKIKQREEHEPSFSAGV